MTEPHWDHPDEEEHLYEYGGLLSCRVCGAPELHWAQIDHGPRIGKWRLFEANGLEHKCEVDNGWLVQKSV